MSNEPLTSPIAKTLEELGLAKNEAILYEILLQTTTATIPYLIKNSPFSRTLLYYILGNLEQFGLITTAKSGSKTTYNAEPPEKIAALLENREKEFKKQKDLLKGVMGDLYSAYRLAHNKPGIKFFEGLDGLREIYKDTLSESNKSIYALLSADTPNDELRDWLNQTYAPLRTKHSIKAKVIAPRSTSAEQYQKQDSSYLRETRLVDGKQFPVEIEVNIYAGNKIAFISFKENEMVGTIISSPAIYNSMRSFFQLAWLQAANDISNKSTDVASA